MELPETVTIAPDNSTTGLQRFEAFLAAQEKVPVSDARRAIGCGIDRAHASGVSRRGCADSAREYRKSPVLDLTRR